MHDDEEKADGDYKVGYRRPPRHTQFQPGQSGNKKGRPKKSKGLEDLIERELDKKIKVKEDGKVKSTTKREALVTQLVNGAIKGDTKPLQLVISHLGKHRPVEPFTPTDADDAALLAALSGLNHKDDDDGDR